jgi:hypothetical protein
MPIAGPSNSLGAQPRRPVRRHAHCRRSCGDAMRVPQSRSGATTLFAARSGQSRLRAIMHIHAVLADMDAEPVASVGPCCRPEWSDAYAATQAHRITVKWRWLRRGRCGHSGRRQSPAGRCPHRSSTTRVAGRSSGNTGSPPPPSAMSFRWTLSGGPILWRGCHAPVWADSRRSGVRRQPPILLEARADLDCGMRASAVTSPALASPQWSHS